jgi:hypothetical protein
MVYEILCQLSTSVTPFSTVLCSFIESILFSRKKYLVFEIFFKKKKENFLGFFFKKENFGKIIFFLGNT